MCSFTTTLLVAVFVSSGVTGAGLAGGTDS